MGIHSGLFLAIGEASGGGSRHGLKDLVLFCCDSGVVAPVLGVVPARATGPLAGASSVAGDVPDGMWYDLMTGELGGDALGRDAALAAEQSGESKALLAERFREQQKMDGVIAQLQARYGDAFAGLYWQDSQVVVQFKSAIPASFQQLFAGTGARVRAEVVKYSSRELERLEADLVGYLKASGFEEYLVALEPSTQRLVATINIAGVARPPSPEALLAGEPRSLLHTTVSIDLINGPVSTNMIVGVVGGQRVGSVGDFLCTSGFSVYAGGTKGTGTAGHCTPAPTLYWDVITGEQYNLQYRNGYIGSWGDFQWLTTSGTVRDDFYAGSALYDVSAVRATFSVGDGVFWYGQASHAVYYSTVAFTGLTISGRGHLVCTQSAFGTTGGDSGGPVYMGNSAMGYITLTAVINGVKRMCFSEATYIDEALGVSILLS